MNTVKDILTHLSDLGIQLELVDENLDIIIPEHVELPDALLEEIKLNKKYLLDHIRQVSGHKSSVIHPVEMQKEYGLSPSQRRLWILSRSGAASVAYNMSAAFRFTGLLQSAALQHAFHTIIDRHEILRTVFRTDAEGNIYQQVLPADRLGFALETEDVRHYTSSDAAIKERMDASVMMPFDLASGPLLRGKLFQTKDDEHVFLFIIHHIVSDAWSMEVFFNELLTLYNAYRQNQPSPLSPPSLQYKDYAAWYLGQVSSGRIARQQAYWLDKFKGELPVIELPGQKKRPMTKTYNGDVVYRDFDRTTVSELQAFSKANGATLYTGLLSAVNALLFRYTSQQDLILGIPVAGRELPELSGQIGFYVNTVALRTFIDQEDTFEVLLQRVRKTAFEAFDNQLFPFDELVEQLNLVRSQSRSPLFDIMVVLQNAASVAQSRHMPAGPDGLLVSVWSQAAFTSKFDLTFNFYETTDGLSLGLEYNSDIYTKEFASQLSLHLEQLMAAMLAKPGLPLKNIIFLSKAEQALQLESFNPDFNETRQYSSVAQLFERQAASTPEHTAVIYQNTAWTYLQLHELSGRFASYLKNTFVLQSEEPVCLRMRRSEKMIMALLGILKAGAAYVPVDTDYPGELVQYIIDDSRCRIVVDDAMIDNFMQYADLHSILQPVVDQSLDSLAYIIYTSGTTGRPKGVQVRQRSIIRLVQSPNYVHLDGTETLLVTGSPSFDSVTFEYWSMLLNGGRLVLADKNELLTPGGMRRLIQEHAVSIMWLTSSWFNEQISLDKETFHGVSKMLIGGDKLSAPHINTLIDSVPGITIINGYGPTENTTFSLCHKIEERYEHDIPIGKPVSNSTVYILDRQKALLPLGAVGEIFVGGDGLARGYNGLTKLTAEKFIANPYVPGALMYRTGDLGKWGCSGAVEYIGRIDEQIKLRGYRIEPGEIENALLGYMGLQQVSVVLYESRGEKELVAYFVSATTLDIPSVKSWLRSQLPAYMVPRYLMQLNTLPVTANGKIDRRALPSPEQASAGLNSVYEAPANELEEKVAAVWSRVLGQEQISVQADFFESGGHSLRATRLISLYEKELHTSLSLEDLFGNTTIRSQAKLIAIAPKRVFAAIDKAPDQPYYALSSAQKRLFFLHEFAPLSTSYNIPLVLYLGKQVDKAKITDTLTKLVHRHEGLRTSFIYIDGEAMQQIHSEVEIHLDEHYCRPEDLQAYTASYIRPFSLGNAPLIRTALVEIENQGFVWIVDIHHIVSDGTSHEVLAEDFMRLYAGEELPPLRLQYKDFSEWQNHKLQTGELEAQNNYWKQQLSGDMSRINLPLQRARPATFTFEGGSYTFSLGEDLSLRLGNFYVARQGTLQMALLAVLHVLYYKYTGQNDLVTGVMIAGRRHPDLERIIGMFVNALPVRSWPEEEKTFSTFYEEMAATCLAAYENQDVQFEDIVELVQASRDPSRNPIFDIALVVQNFERAQTGNNPFTEVLTAEQEESIRFQATTSKFDLTWFVFQENGNISINLEYYSAIFDVSAIARMAEHFIQVLQTALDNPGILLADIDLITAGDEKYILTNFIKGQLQPYPDGTTLHELFSVQSFKSPGDIAVKADEINLTYLQLEEQTNQLSHFLYHHLNIATGSRIGILQMRSSAAVVSIFAVMKAGGTYVPLDPQYPEDRLLYMIEDAGIEVLLTEKSLVELANKLQWRSSVVSRLVCADSNHIDEETGFFNNDLMLPELWDHVGDTAVDDISGGGWQSSYTGDNMSKPEMREYASNVYTKLKDHLHSDMKVLEIGCSSGITLFEIAGHVGQYYGVDLSAKILANTQKKVDESGLSNVTLINLPAHEIDLMKEKDFDLVIMNSVIHCFNGYNYLKDVLVKTVGKIKDTGWLFLGDVMDEAKRSALIADLTEFKEANRNSSYRTKTDWSAELFISKDYLSDLISDGIGITSVSCSEKLHTIPNELTRYRYDAMLRVDKSALVIAPPRKKYRYDLRQIRNHSISPLHLPGKADQLAYILYTSGSTGKPKGVMLSHRSVINYIYYALRTYAGQGQRASFGLFTSLSFDLTVTSIFCPLLSGGYIRIYNPLLETPDVLKQYFAGLHEPELIKLTPPHIDLLANLNLPESLVRKAVVGGSELKPAHIAILRTLNAGMRIFNEYGPTEATVGCTVWEVSGNYSRILIGKPISNTSVYILDNKGRLVPEAITGEICVAGPGLAKGYYNQDMLTREKFVTANNNDERLYRTGDLGRWMEDGNIEFLGRKDDQVKIRGYRVETGEIEEAIVSLGGIREALVLAKEMNDGEQGLFAWLVSEERLDSNLISVQLREILPDYMIPVYFVQVPAFPLTPNGKINKAALPLPQEYSRSGSTPYIPPFTETERTLVAIWEKVLGVDPIGIKDNFFALGGHSLKATRLTSLYEKELKVTVSLRKVFEMPTIEEHARLIATQETSDYREIPKAEKKPLYALSSAQKRLFFLNELMPESTGYNMPVVEFLGTGFDAARVKRTFNKLIERHTGLRTSFVKVDGKPFQKVQDKVFFLLDQYECSLTEFQAYLENYIRPFDLSEAPLMRAAFVHIRDIGDVLVVDEHHIISDGVSHEMLITEFLQLYQGSELSALKLQYPDFSEWQNNLLSTGAFDRQKQYWLDLYADGIPSLDLYGDHPRPPAFTFEGNRVGFTVDASTFRSLKRLGKQYGGTMQMTLLSILNVLLYKYTGNEDIVVGVGIAGRNHADTEGIYGMFVNSLAIRNRPAGQKHFDDFYAEVKTASLAAYENQDVQFDDLVDWLKIERDPSRNPLFDVLLVVQNYERADAIRPDIKTEPGKDLSSLDWDLILYTNTTAKFDLTFHVWENDEDMYISIEYYAAIFERAFIERMINHFNEAIRSVLSAPDALIDDLDILAVQEKEVILRDFVSGPVKVLPDNGTVHECFSRQSKLTPGNVAVIDASEQLTYADLEKRSNQLSHFLLSTIRPRPEAKIALLQDRNASLMVSILGILKSGSAYLPLDVSFPEERLLFMLADSGADTIITDRNLVDLANRLQWRSENIRSVICINSENYYNERGGVFNQLTQKDLWDHVGDTATDAITAGGWLSSYTGKPISREEMNEYSINTFLKLQPYLHSDMKVLEIGCSSGLTMFRVAPLVKTYYGTDLSSSILERTRKEADALEQQNIFLSCMPASAIDDLGEQDFDLIIINSVIQCFEGHNYLRDVLVKAIGLLKHKGHLFLGDLMDEDRRDLLIRSLRSYRAEHIAEKDIKTKTDWSAELFISKGFLTDLVSENIGITQASFSDKIYTIPNELTLFRFDAFLTINKDEHIAVQERKKFQYDLRDINSCNDDARPVLGNRNSLCYVMYTSGSTGQPKGVMIEHGGVLRLADAPDFVHLSEQSCLLATGSPSFDATTFEFWGMLLNGGKLVLLPQESLLDPQLLKRYIKSYGVTIMWFTAGWLNELVDTDISIFSELRCVIAGGDRLSAKHIVRLLQHYPGLKIINGYGPTENTTFSLTQHINNVEGENLPVGKPISNSSAWILDKQGKLVPIGVIGEINLGGDGLARCYLNNDRLTLEKFIAHPYMSGTRLYRSGDLGRWLPDGTIEFIGRKDNQVKIRGYRVEPGEIENCLVAKEYISNAAVIVMQSIPHRILAFVVLQDPLADTSIITADISESLPAYMVPDRFIVMDHLPLTDNGKVDRKALLLANKGKVHDNNGHAAPVNALEKRLAEIWSDLLGGENIGLHDDFFQSGGHSLKAISLIGAYHKEFGIRIALKDIFDKTTIREHALLIGEATGFAKPDTVLIPLNKAIAGNEDMILIPAISGNSIQFRDFADVVREDFNCYGLDYPGFDLIEKPRDSITEIAQEFSGAISNGSFNKERTLLIMGYSMGGIIAFEVCKELERKGFHCRLILVDRPVVDETGAIDRFSEEEVDDYLDLLIRSFYGDTAEDITINRMKLYLRHNLHILDNQLTTGIITSNIISIDAVTAEQPHKMAGWSKHTSGYHRIYPIHADHYEIFQKKNCPELKAILYSACKPKAVPV